MLSILNLFIKSFIYEVKMTYNTYFKLILYESDKLVQKEFVSHSKIICKFVLEIHLYLFYFVSKLEILKVGHTKP